MRGAALEDTSSWYLHQLDAPPVSDDEHARTRRELAAFLRNRRARLAPREVGLDAGTRRRTPGLRREEVARLAGVGLTWYTWFEQGRNIQVSAHFLDRVAVALQLNAAERGHLFMLAQQRPPAIEPPRGDGPSPLLRRLLASLPHPSYVKTARWDVLDWSPAFSRVFGDLAHLPPARRNMLWLAFVHPKYRRMMANWENDARAMLASFRVEFARHGNDQAFHDLVRELSEESPEFRAWWREHDVLEPGEGVKRFQHEALGALDFEHASFSVDAAPGLRLVVYTPVPGDTTARVERLVRQ
jgi:transcriptional regulator with XRE-family HTH domain